MLEDFGASLLVTQSTQVHKLEGAAIEAIFIDRLHEQLATELDVNLENLTEPVNSDLCDLHFRINWQTKRGYEHASGLVQPYDMDAQI